jgi:drug/metabolite transporter (DMT)-like permease
VTLNRRAWAVIELTLAVIFWGVSFVATKVALEDVEPVTVVWLRFAIGVGMLGIAVLARRQRKKMLHSDIGYFALLGFLGITFHQWLQSTGLQTAQATTTAWIVATTPIFMALLGWLLLRESLNAAQILGITLAALGVILVVSNGDFSTLVGGQFGAPGDLLVLISAPNWAVFSVLSRRGLQRYAAAQMVFYIMVFGLLFTTVLFLLGPGFADIANLSTRGWAAIVFLGVFCSGLAYIFWYDGLEALPVAQVGAFVYLEPFITVVFAALFLKEPLLLSSVLGGITILIGVWLVQKKKEVGISGKEGNLA